MDNYPHGPIPKFKPRDRNHRMLFAGHSDAPYLFTTFTNSVWLANRPDVMELMFSPEQSLILANVEDDDYLVGRTPRDEIERIKTLEPDYYIPSDRWVYEETMSTREQLEEIDRCLSGTEEVTEWVRSQDDLNTKIIPIVKGWERWHFERSREVFEELGFSYCAFDVTQYNSRKLVIKDVHRMRDVIRPDGILLIGRLDTSTLERCPAEVAAATGVNQWLKHSRSEDGRFDRDRYSDWVKTTNDALSSLNRNLSDFTEKSEGQLELEHFLNKGDVNIHG